MKRNLIKINAMAMDVAIFTACGGGEKTTNTYTGAEFDSANANIGDAS